MKSGLITVIMLWIASMCPARADFSGPYYVPMNFYPLNTGPQVIPVGTWTLMTSGFETQTYFKAFAYTSAPEVTLYTGVTAQHGFQPSLLIAFTNSIVADGMLTFDYALTLEETGQYQYLNYGAYTLNGVVTQLQPGTGSIGIAVSAGDVFGFLAYGTAACFSCDPAFAGGTRLTVSTFNAPIPETATVSLFVSGAALLAILRRSRSRKSRSG